MKIAIIGSDSFLAGYIINELIKTNAQITLWGLSEAKYPELAFTKFCFPDAPLNHNLLLNYDAIVYCAGAGIQASLIEDKNLIYELNAFQPIQLINHLIKNNFEGKFFSFGSYFEIGDSESEMVFDENFLLTSRLPVPNDYCISKRIFSRFVDSKQNQIRCFHFILPNIYGKNENSSRIIPAVIQSILSNNPITFTAGTQIRQYLHVQDIAEQISKCIFESLPHGIYNITISKPVKVMTLIKTIYEVMQVGYLIPTLKFGQEQRDDNKMPYLLLDDTKAKVNLMWNPRISLSEGIKSYLQ